MEPWCRTRKIGRLLHMMHNQNVEAVEEWSQVTRVCVTLATAQSNPHAPSTRYTQHAGTCTHSRRTHAHGSRPRHDQRSSSLLPELLDGAGDALASQVELEQAQERHACARKRAPPRHACKHRDTVTSPPQRAVQTPALPDTARPHTLQLAHQLVDVLIEANCAASAVRLHQVCGRPHP